MEDGYVKQAFRLKLTRAPRWREALAVGIVLLAAVIMLLNFGHYRKPVPRKDCDVQIATRGGSLPRGCAPAPADVQTAP